MKVFQQKIPFKIAVILAILISLTMLLPFVLYGVPYAPDNIHHFQVASSYAQAISAGDFFPSWSAHENFGYGSLGIRLYPPFPYYILAFIHFATGEWFWASLITYAFWILLNSFGVYLLARELYSPGTALLSTVIFAFMPYRYYEVYHATMYGEFAGSAVLVFSFYFVFRVCKHGKYIDVFGLTIAYAVLILTHLPLTIIGSICLLVFSITLLDRRKIFRTLTLLTSSVSISLVMTSFFWVRVLTERKWMACHSIYFPELIFSYKDNFLPYTSFDDLRMLYFDSFLLLPIILVGISLLVSFNSNIQKRIPHTFSIKILFIFSCIIMLKISSSLWESIFLLQETQFPWRFLVITSISAAILAASGWQNFFENYQDSKRPIALLLCGSFLIMIIYCFAQPVRNAAFMSNEEFTQWRYDNDRAIGLEFWWTIWARYEAVKPSEKVLTDNRGIQIEEWTATRKKFDVSSGGKTFARLALFYYPYWQAKVNGTAVTPERTADGAISILIPAEKSSVELWFQEPFYNILARYVSMAAWLLVFVIGLLYIFSKFRKNRTNRLRSKFPQ